MDAITVTDCPFCGVEVESRGQSVRAIAGHMNHERHLYTRGRRHWQHTPITPDDLMDFAHPYDAQLAALRSVAVIRRVVLRPYFVAV